MLIICLTIKRLYYNTLIEHLPLKQGLRLLNAISNNDLGLWLIEHLPLKQGLRLPNKTA